MRTKNLRIYSIISFREMGLNSNIEIWAYEKLRDTTIEYQLNKNKLKKDTPKEKLLIN